MQPKTRNTMQPLFEVTRPNGSVQYFHKWDEQYFPIGGGFSVSKFADGSTVKEVDAIPTRFTDGVCYFEDGPKFRCICDMNSNWNGWALPFMHASEAKRFIRSLKNKSHIVGTTLMIDVSDSSDNDFEKIELSAMEGYPVYDLGNLGWCWDFKKRKVN